MVQWIPRFSYQSDIYDSAILINEPHGDFPLRVMATCEAINTLFMLMDSGGYKHIDENMIKAIHLWIFGEADFRGRYRDKLVTVGNHMPPSPEMVELLMPDLFPMDIKTEKDLMDWYYRFEMIHPFEDGNGRVGGVITAVIGALEFGKFLVPDNKGRMSFIPKK